METETADDDYPIQNQSLYNYIFTCLDKQNKLHVEGIEFTVYPNKLIYGFKYESPLEKENVKWYWVTSIYDGLGYWRELVVMVVTF